MSKLTGLFQSKSLALTIPYYIQNMFSFHVHIHLGEVFAGLALILMATGMEVTGNG